MATAKGRKSPSLGRQCASYGCYSREYIIENGERRSAGISLFCFPSDLCLRKAWCNLIKRQDGQDGFQITAGTRICDKHFPSSMIYKPPGGTRKRLVDGAKPILHPWNDFSESISKRKAPAIRVSPKPKSPRKKLFIENDELNDVTSHNDNINSLLSELNIVKRQLEEEKIKNSFITNENEQLRIVLNNKCLQVDDLTNKNKMLQEKLNNCGRKQNMINTILESDEKCKFYTGFPSLITLNDVFEFLNAGPDGENVVLHNNKEFKGERCGRKRTFTPFESYLITLVKLRQGFSVKHLQFLFESSEATISNTFTTWINFLYLRLGSVCIWPTREKIKESMPNSMKELFPSTRCIIDCAEFKVEVPSSLFTHKMLYSDYKSHTTVKVLVGIAPGGGFSFISSSYPGSISDKNIVVKSGFLNPELWEPGDSVMADRGFTIKEYFQPLKVDLIIPSFLDGRDQFSTDEVVHSQQIAHERIHVERMIQRLKSYHIFDRVIPLTMLGSLNQIITVCGLLSNFQDPIIKKDNV